MINSMTAFGSGKETGDWGSATLEIRTVNHRYLDMNVRLPDEVRVLESVFRDEIQKQVKRGKVDCTLRLETGEMNSAALTLNRELAEKLIQLAASLPINRPQPINPVDVLRLPGVIDNEKLDMDDLEGPIRSLLKRTLGLVMETRRREGGKIRTMLLERCEDAGKLVTSIRNRLPEIVTGLRSRYQQRVSELLAEPDHDRLEQEILLLIQKMDVAEELDRLEMHVNEVKRVLDQEEPVGRRLDFLMQEMNRESNTLASKSANIDTTNASIDLKVLIEQMREQIQNIE
jgi:uncharacterized protein (TIGR00255 family)